MREIRVLLADDHQIILDGIKLLIEKDAAETAIRPTILKVVAMAHNGEEVLRLMETIPVDVAVLDISMPLLDGLGAARRIRRLYPDTKIILLTMQGDSHFILNALRSGVNGYVVKEKSSDTLLHAIRQVFQGSTYYSPELLGKIRPDQLDTSSDEEVHLTSREQEIMCYMAKNPEKTAEEIGKGLHIATATVQAHIRNVKQKLNMNKAGELILYAVENNLCT